eukprot:2327446-Pyramimonas_sp.AAC.2
MKRARHCFRVGRGRGRGQGISIGTQSARDAGAELLSLMIRMYATCKLSAKEFCLMCHWAHNAGTPGADFQQYAVQPDQQS